MTKKGARFGAACLKLSPTGIRGGREGRNNQPACKMNPKAPGVGKRSDLSELQFPHLGNRDKKISLRGLPRKYIREHIERPPGGFWHRVGAFLSSLLIFVRREN